jgi:hypothetical protein
MGARKTESRIPANYQPSDLGEAVVASDGRCALISFLTGPIVLSRDNTYVLVVTDSALASTTESFEWTFAENGSVTEVKSTTQGEIIYQPAVTGTLRVDVRILDAGNSEQAAVSLEQQIVSPSAILEDLIAGSQNVLGPSVGDPIAARELVNEHSAYYKEVQLQKPEDSDAFQRFLFNMVSAGATRASASDRWQYSEKMASALNEQPDEFARLATVGLGVCNIRLALLAMVLVQSPGGTGFLPWHELPEEDTQRAFADEQLCASLSALPEGSLIDLFNIVRFPKSNITACGKILEALRDRYFTGTSFQDVVMGMSGTRGHWIVKHFREGPLAHE